MRFVLLPTFMLLACFGYSQNYVFDWASPVERAQGMTGVSSQVTDMEANEQGFTYQSGHFAGIADLDPGIDSLLFSSSNGHSFVRKLDPFGNLVWARQLGARTISLAIDQSENLILIGYFVDTMDADPGMSVHELYPDSGSAYIIKLNSNGNFQWARQFGNEDIDVLPTVVAMDDSLNVIVGGMFRDTVDLNPDSVEQYEISKGSYDAFLLKISSEGSFNWARSFGGQAFDEIHEGLAINTSGQIFLGGEFRDSLDVDPGIDTVMMYAYAQAGYGNFFSKFSANGILLWSKQFTSNFRVEHKSVGFGNQNETFLMGNYWDTLDLDPGAGAVWRFADNNEEPQMYLINLDEDGDYNWGIAYDLLNSDGPYIEGKDLWVDDQNTSTIVGRFGGPFDFFYTLDTMLVYTTDSLSEIFVLQIDSSGDYKGVYTYGGYEDDDGESISIDVSGSIYTSGWLIDHIDFDPGEDSVIHIANNRDQFVHKMSPCDGLSYQSIDISACDSFASPSGNTTYTASGTYNDTIEFTDSCSTVYTLTVTINHPTTDTVYETACDSLTWMDGTTYSSSGSAIAELIDYNQAGCDSIIVLDLEILNSTSYTDVYSLCDSLQWIDGETYTQSNNEATYILTNAQGCDSLVNIDLTILPGSNSIDTNVACDSFTWINGTVYTESNNTAIDTLSDMNGCDSIVHLNLTLHQSVSKIDSIASCEPITWIDGNEYATSNNSASVVFETVNGCDSIVTLNLTISSATNSIDSVATCNEFLWSADSTVYTTTGTYFTTLTNMAGCDSNLTLHLTLQASSKSFTTYSCGPFESPTGQLWDTSGVYNDTLTNQNGCDSILTYYLTVQNIDNSVTTAGAQLTSNETGAIYKWIKCDSNGYSYITGAIYQSYTATTNGDYAVRIAKLGCIDTSDCVNVSSLGWADINGFEDIVAYPNPTDGIITIDLAMHNNVTIRLYDAQGKLLRELFNLAGINEIEIQESAGVYTLELINQDQHRQLKVIRN